MIRKYLGKIGKRFYKLLLSTVLACILILSAMEVFFGYYQAKVNAERTQKQVLDFLSFRTVENIEKIKSAMKLTITSKGVLERGLTERFGFYLKKLVKNEPAVLEAVAIDADGKEVAVESKVRLSIDRKDRRGEEFFKESIKGKIFISKVYPLNNTKSYITISMPISLYGNRHIGVLAVKVSLFELQKVIAETKIGESGYAYLADDRGNVIAHPTLRYAIGGFNINNVPNLKGFQKVYEEPSKVHHFFYKNPDGIFVFGSARIIPDLGWMIGVSQPVRDIFRHLIDILILFVSLSFFAFFILYYVAKRLSENLTSPILELYETAERVSQGKIGETVNIETDDEIGGLAKVFNKMSLNLKELYTNMEQKIDERTKEVMTLFSFTSAISKDIDLKNILTAAGEELVFALEANGYCFYSVIEGKGEVNFNLVQFDGCDEEEAKRFLQLIFEKRSSLFKHEPVIFNHIEGEFTAKNEKIGSLGMFPVSYLGRVLAVFLIFSKKGEVFTEEVTSLIDTCMLQLGSAIKNSLLYDEIKELSLKDPLTGLANRRYFDAKMEYEFTRFKRYERPFSLLMLDIDHFKKINDTYGHQSGDAILKGLGERLINFVRKADFPARYGGEEFAIIMPETNLNQAFLAGERLRKMVEGEVFDIEVEPYKIKITISLGCAEARVEMNDWQELVELADRALYDAKQSGRNRTVAVRGDL